MKPIRVGNCCTNFKRVDVLPSGEPDLAAEANFPLAWPLRATLTGRNSTGEASIIIELLNFSLVCHYQRQRGPAQKERKQAGSCGGWTDGGMPVIATLEPGQNPFSAPPVHWGRRPGLALHGFL